MLCSSRYQKMCSSIQNNVSAERLRSSRGKYRVSDGSISQMYFMYPERTNIAEPPPPLASGGSQPYYTYVACGGMEDLWIFICSVGRTVAAAAVVPL